MASESPADLYQPQTPIVTNPAMPAPDIGWLDQEVWSAAWKRSGAQEDWGLNQQRYMQESADSTWEELRKRGYKVQKPSYTPASVVARNVRGQPRDPTGSPFEYGEFWNAVRTEQAKDQKFAPELAGIQDNEGLYQHAINRRKADMEAADATLGRASGTARIGTSLTTALGRGLLDPTSYIPVPGAGPSTSVARSILSVGAREAAANIAIGAAMEPFVRADVKALGGERTMEDTLLDLSIQGGAGFLIGGAAGGIGYAVSKRAIESSTASDRLLTETFRATVPEDQWTPDQRAAINALDRNADIVEASPYLPGRAGDETHLDNMAEGFGGALGGASVKSPPRYVQTKTVTSGAGKFRAPAVETFMARVRSAETSGDDLAAAQTSSAFGRYQFTKGTWLSYFNRRYPDSGLSKAQILAKRSDGTMQDLLMRDLTADNARTLGDAGIPASETNLYITHFAGPRDALKILQADAARPIESVMSAASIKANPWLQGKTVGEFHAWAQRKMGEPSSPHLAEGGVAADPVLSAMEVEVRMLETQKARADWLPDNDYPQLRAELFDSPEDHSRAQIEAMASRDASDGFDFAYDEPVPGVVLREDEEVLGAQLEQISQFEQARVVLDREALLAVADTGDGVDMQLAGDSLRDVADLALAEGREVTLVVEGKRIPITAPNLVDSKGRQWGAMPILVPAPGDAARLEIGPPALPPDVADLRQSLVAKGIDPAMASREEMQQAVREIRRPVFTEAFGSSERAVSSIAPPKFEHPDGPEAKMQSDSLEHDIRMALDEGNDPMVTLGENEEPRRLSDILAELDEDEDAVAILRSCMIPQRGAA